MGKIKKVMVNSLAEELELEKGDSIVKINGIKLGDIVDYYFLMADEYICLEILKKDGNTYEIEIDKDEDELLGVEWEHPTIDKIRTCHNDCIFCFVKQSPKNIRSSLQIKDDDYRLSFLDGNYVTLTNVNDEELNRIVKLRMSPINVSVHTTRPELRKKMLNNKNAGKIMQQLSFLVENGIEVNSQIVLCPGVNDNAEIDRSIKDLLELQPMLKSISVVPVGLTNYRAGLIDLRLITKEEAKKIIEKIEKYQSNNFLEHKRATVYAADELYVIADQEVPPAILYDSYDQLENGVGLIRLFKEQFEEVVKVIKNNPDYKYSKKKYLLLTGISAFKIINEATNKIASFTGVDIDCLAVPSIYYGEQVTVTGLITATDIINLQKCQNNSIIFNNYDIIIIPEVMFKDQTMLFLDDIDLEQLKKITNREYIVTSSNPIGLLDIILEKGFNNA